MSKATVIYCPSRTDLTGKRVLFLAGPSRFAPLWRIEAITYLLRRLKGDMVIASPQRLDDMTSGPHLPQKKKEQMDWELDHFLLTVKRGICLFWLPRSVADTKGQNYGEHTARLLALAAVFRWREGLDVVIGAEKGYSDLYSTSYTFRRFAPEGENGLKLHTTIDATCDAALRILN